MYLDRISTSILTRSPIFNLDRFVSLRVCGIVQTSKPFFVNLDIVNETPFISIDPFSTS